MPSSSPRRSRSVCDAHTGEKDQARDFFNPDGRLRDIKDLDDDTAAAIASMDVVELSDGSQGDQKHVTGLVKKIRFADKLKALELYGRYFKPFTDKVEHSRTLKLEQLVCGGVDD